MSVQHQRPNRAWQTRSAITGLWLVSSTGILVIGGLMWWLTALPPAGSIGPNVFIGSLPVGGLPLAEAHRVLQLRIDAIKAKGVMLRYGQEQTVLSLTTEPTSDLDVAYEVVSYDISASVQRAYAVGRRWRISANAAPATVPAVVTMRRDKLLEAITASFPDLGVGSKNPGFVLDKTTRQPVVTPGTVGRLIATQPLLTSLQRGLEALEAPREVIRSTETTPSVSVPEATQLLPQVVALIDRLPVALMFGDQRWELTAEKLLPLLTVARTNGSLSLALGQDFASTVLDPIILALDQPASPPKFTLTDGRVTLWQPPKNGQKLNTGLTLQRFNQALFQDGALRTVELAVDIKVAPSVDGEGRDLGIQELIGVGRSNFKGSPPNRRHNIAVGAAALNGLLIAPDETFSLLKALGDIDATNGYLPELVIKGNKTIPEYGGGLCQIGTTTFRAALASGLPIVERQNHSYRVPYYEPAGTDATIYSPKPDFRFLNDTGHSILIQTKIIKDDLVFEFWGTKDQRVVVQTPSKIYNIQKPPAKKVIPTIDLKPGEEKCTERAHSGADAEFTYTVTYADGTVKTETFRSHYRPWQEVCLVGVASLPMPATVEGGSATAPPATAPATPEAPGADSPAAVTP